MIIFFIYLLPFNQSSAHIKDDSKFIFISISATIYLIYGYILQLKNNQDLIHIYHKSFYMLEISGIYYLLLHGFKSIVRGDL